jgi:eukaryotic-like serine/threonine-protein kinase
MLCKTCGRPIREDGLGGLCASCMMGLVLEDPGTQPADKARLGQTGGASMEIPGYHVRGEIARGGMGIVYRALQDEPRREVALKMLLPHQVSSPGMLERFRLEARAIAALEHPAILPVHHVGEHNRLPYFTMKLASGGSLVQRKEELAGDWRRIAELVATLADAVQFAHERGVLHRDLKPGNVLFDEAGRPYVSDFGLAKLTAADSDLTRSVDLLGTPHYVAPEVAARSAKEATTASDIYSLGAILYELLAGHPPFQAEGVPALLKKIAEEEPGPISDSRLISNSKSIAPRDLEIISRKCLAKEPGRRYATAKELAQDLRRWMDGRTILARPATTLERVHSWARRNPALATMSALLAVVLVVAVIWESHSNRQLQQALAESLLRQAQLERSSGRAGQRFETLELISRAAKQLPASDVVSLRTEVAAALALGDLRSTSRWRVAVGHLQNEFDFTADLDRYVAPTSGGGFVVASTGDRKTIHEVPGVTNNPAIKLRIHPKGIWAAARFRDGHAELHSLTTTNQAARRWPGVPNTSVLFEFARSGELFAVVTATRREGRLAEIIDLNTGLATARVPAANATTVLFDPAGKHLAVAGSELSVWRVVDTNKLWSAPLSHEASALAWSPDGNRLAVALERRNPVREEKLLKACPVILFDAVTGKEQSTFGQFNSRVACMAFHPTRAWLAVATWDDGLVFGSAEWDNARFTVESAHRALSFSVDGRRLAYAPTREELGVMEVAMPSAFGTWQSAAGTEEAFKLAASDDGKWVVTTSATMAHLWDTTSRTRVDSRALPAKAIWVEALFGPENQYVYVSASSFGVWRWTLTNGPDGRLRFGDAQLTGEDRGFMASRFANDRRSLVVGEHRGGGGPTMWLWPDADPQRARKLAGDFPMTGYAVVPGSRWAVTTAIAQPDVWIWDYETGERLRNLGLAGRASSEPLANGRWLVARNRDEFGVWETGTWKRVAQWPARPDEASMTIYSSPDSRLLATYNASGRFVLRELPSGKELILLTPPQSIPVQNFQFSADSTRLLFVSNNGQMFDWDLSEIRRALAKLGLDWSDTH